MSSSKVFVRLRGTAECAYDDCSVSRCGDTQCVMAPTHQRSDAHLEPCNKCARKSLSVRACSTTTHATRTWHSSLVQAVSLYTKLFWSASRPLHTLLGLLPIVSGHRLCLITPGCQRSKLIHLQTVGEILQSSGTCPTVQHSQQGQNHHCVSHCTSVPNSSSMPRSLIRGTHFPNVHQTLNFQLTRISLDSFRQWISLNDMIDPETLLQDDVLCIDRHASWHVLSISWRNHTVPIHLHHFRDASGIVLWTVPARFRLLR